MFAISKDTTAAEILKARQKTGLFIKAPAFKASERPQMTIKAEPFASLAFESALDESKNPTITHSLSPAELEAFAREYAEEEASSSLTSSLIPA